MTKEFIHELQEHRKTLLEAINVHKDIEKANRIHHKQLEDRCDHMYPAEPNRPNGYYPPTTAMVICPVGNVQRCMICERYWDYTMPPAGPRP